MDRKIHIVRDSDTLWGIARDELGDPNKYRDIREWNHLKGLLLKPGQVLLLYNPSEEQKY